MKYSNSQQLRRYLKTNRPFSITLGRWGVFQGSIQHAGFTTMSQIQHGEFSTKASSPYFSVSALSHFLLALSGASTVSPSYEHSEIYLPCLPGHRLHLVALRATKYWLANVKLPPLFKGHDSLGASNKSGINIFKWLHDTFHQQKINFQLTV